VTPAAPNATAAELCQRCVAQLEDALSRPPDQLSQKVDLVEREVAHLRDQLIAALRQQGTGAASGRRAALDKVNAALSLIVGVEYPVAGIQRSALAQARDTLRQVLEDGSLG
jgi:hypothetical protein